MSYIKQTTEYSQFKFLDRNRKIYPQYLIESILKKNLLAEHPIICDENFNVIDGQHRLKAAEFLKIPIYYIISENVSSDDIGICQNQKPWGMADFMNFYEKNEDYHFVKEMMRIFSLPIHFVVSCCNSTTGILKKFRQGQFIIKKSKTEISITFKRLKEIIFLFEDIKRNAGEKKIVISSKVMRSLWVFTCQTNYDHNRFIHSIETYPCNVLPILNFNSEKIIGEAFMNRLYNFKRKSK